ncbi:flavodoxin family protein [Vitiosangium sp. GDMCC 1.1324]|uniref:flavodoxin family protein n=1 Tax=Vitiosangium sp. (strain GDMCC 1.1324) TaxID=2138576 RepID=UPI0018EEBBE0|nr:NAD(P)H-dependent oxidoreductase [Vitiosangium sp. GDMCC 1.1324]
MSTFPSTSPLPSTPRRILFLLASARENGNAEQLARRTAEVLSPDTLVDWVRLDAYAHESFRDLRHTPEGYPEPSPAMRALAELTLAADELVFVAPVYWYSIPASAKLYLDHWSWWMRLPKLRFKERMRGKVLSLITSHASDDADGVEQPSISTLRMSADYLHMHWRGALVGHGDKPGEVLTDSPVLESARSFLLRPVGKPTTQVA